MRNVMTGLLLVGGSTLLSSCQDNHPGISNGELLDRLSQLESRALDNLIFIEGGTFTMGDFGAVGDDDMWRPYFPPTAERNKAHEVTLSNYSLCRQKTTWEDFDTYLLTNDLPVIELGLPDDWDRPPFSHNPDSRFFISKPAEVTWQQAKDYCTWLGQRTGLPLDLPTSAQWEFAGRNRGSQEWIFSTHDGQPLRAHPELYELFHEGPDYAPVGSRLPPNPLGIYDMFDNGKEWVNDWFSDTWYRDNPTITDPQGPAEGSKRIVRNLDFSFSRVGMPGSVPSAFNEEWTLVITNTFRCALQRPAPIGKNTP